MMQVKPVSRSVGRSATASAAYRSGTVIECKREGKIHDYTKKSGIVKESSNIFYSDRQYAWANDRQLLWNKAEEAEKRKDARVAREYVIALPKEATEDERDRLSRQFSMYLTQRYKVAVDMNIHAPHKTKNGDNDNHHAHLLTTTRKLTRDGLGEKSDIELSDTDRKKLGLSSGKDEMKHLRKVWADMQNVVLRKYGVQVSELSLEDQGVEREATVHMGATATELERKGIKTAIGDHNREIETRNTQRLESPLDLEQEIRVTERLLSDYQKQQAQEKEKKEKDAQILRDAERAEIASLPLPKLSMLEKSKAYFYDNSKDVLKEMQHEKLKKMIADGVIKLKTSTQEGRAEILLRACAEEARLKRAGEHWHPKKQVTLSVQEQIKLKTMELDMKTEIQSKNSAQQAVIIRKFEDMVSKAMETGEIHAILEKRPMPQYERQIALERQNNPINRDVSRDADDIEL